MKTYFFIITMLLIQNCNQKSTNQISDKLPYDIDYIFLQKWANSKQQPNKGTHFEIKFKNHFPKNVTLQKVYFDNQEAQLLTEKPTLFTAQFYQNNLHDLNLSSNPENEYGNSIPIITKQKFNLQANEVILEFSNQGKPIFYKITKVKEKEFINYP